MTVEEEIEVARRNLSREPKPKTVHIDDLDRSKVCEICGRAIVNIGDGVPVWIHYKHDFYTHAAEYREEKEKVDGSK